VFCAKRKITADSVFANGENHERHPPSNTTCVNELPPLFNDATVMCVPKLANSVLQGLINQSAKLRS